MANKDPHLRLDHLAHYANLIDSMLASAGDFPTDVRPIHRPLLVYSELLAMETSGTIDAGIRDSIKMLDESIWSALALGIGGELLHESTWIARSRSAFANLIGHQQSNGLFLTPDAHANPEVRWYDELMLLHAVANYAVRVPGDGICSAVARSAAFHLNETQPDHATAEPWGLLAFIQYAPPLADQVLHAMALQYPNGISGIPLLLLADVRYGLRRLISDNG